MDRAICWNSTESMPDDVTKDQVLLELNTDFSTKGLSAQELTAIVAAWQHGALSRDSMLDLFRRGEILPDGCTNEEEERLVAGRGRRRPTGQRRPILAASSVEVSGVEGMIRP